MQIQGPAQAHTTKLTQRIRMLDPSLFSPPDWCFVVIQPRGHWREEVAEKERRACSVLAAAGSAERSKKLVRLGPRWRLVFHIESPMAPPGKISEREREKGREEGDRGTDWDRVRDREIDRHIISFPYHHHSIACSCPYHIIST